MKAEFVQTQSWRYKTTVVIKRQQQTTISKKPAFQTHTGRLRATSLRSASFVSLTRALVDQSLVNKEVWF